MRNKFLSACLVASSALALSTAASAAGTNIERGAYVGGQAGYSWFEGKENNAFDQYHTKDHKWTGGQIGVRWTPRFSTEISYVESRAKEKGNEAAGKIVHAQMPLISNRFHFDGGVLGFEPYLGVAVGQNHVRVGDPDPNEKSRYKDTLLGPEAGLQRRFAKRLLLDVGARTPYNLDRGKWSGQVYAGLNFLFAVKDRNAAPVSAEVSEAGTAVQFGFDQDTIPASQLSDLNAAARFLNSNKKTSITLEGHTCNIGAAEYNQNLSERRANAAKDYLVSQGVDESRISTLGKGSSQPVADNSTEEGRVRNRRVDAIITGTIKK